MVDTATQQENRVKIETDSVVHILSTLLSYLRIQGKVVESQWRDIPFFVIETDEAPLLIGDRGQHLEALNYLVRKMSEQRAAGAPARFVIDVNSYTKKHFEELRDRALMGAERVKYFKKEVTLQPMSAMERRVVHLTLQDHEEVTTESIGSGVQRRVVIKLTQNPA